MCFGGGGNQTSNVVSKFEPPGYTTEDWKTYLGQSQGLGQSWMDDPESKVYKGNRVAPLVQEQVEAIGGMRGLAMPLFNNPAMLQQRSDAANAGLLETLNGKYLNQKGERNSYGGNSPQFEAMLKNQRKSAEDSYARGTAAQTDAAMARQGAYGGSAYNELTAANNKALNESLNAQETAQRNEQYNRSAGLEEGALNRDFSGFQNERGRQMQGLSAFTGMQAGDLATLQGLLGGGELSRNLDQQTLQSLRDMFNEKIQAPLIGLDIKGGGLSRASGGQGTTTQQTLGPSYSPWQGLLGAGMMGAGMFGK